MDDSRRTPEGAITEGATEPTDPTSPLVKDAIGLHEAYTAYIAAGFTENQALTIIARMTRG